MALEPSFSYIDDLVDTNPNNTPDQVKDAAAHLRGVKKAVQGSFPSLGALAVTKTAAEINDLVQPATVDVLSNKTIASAAFTGTQTGFNGNVTGNVTGNTSGNAGTATNWDGNRTVTLTGDVTGATTNASGTKSISTTLAANTVGGTELISPAVGATIVKRLFAGTPNQTDASPPATDIYVNVGGDLNLSTYVIGTVLVQGTVRISFEHSSTGGGGLAGVRVVKNGTTQQSWSQTGATYVTRTIDVSVAVGDILTLQMYETSGGDHSRVRNANVLSNTANMAIA